MPEGIDSFEDGKSSDYIPPEEKGQPLGVAELDASGYVPIGQLPPSVVDAMTLKGGWDASGGAYPGGTPANGDTYKITVAGTLPLGPVVAGDTLIYKTEAPAGWFAIETNLNIGPQVGEIQQNGAILQATQIVETDGTAKYITVAKQTAHNKAFGTGTGTVCEGDDERLSDVSCSAYDGSGVSIAVSPTWTKVTLDSEEFDTDSMHSGGTITIPVGGGGKYLIVACVTFPGDASGIRGLRLKHNAAYVRTKVANPVGTSKTDLSFAKLLDLSDGDTVEMEAYQSTIAPLTTETGADRTFLQAVKQRGG